MAATFLRIINSPLLRYMAPFLVLTGCYSAPPEQRPSLEPGAAAVRALPAYPLPGERHGAQKGDQYDAIRVDTPEWYAITKPPIRPELRTMVEWEPMHALLISVTPWVTSSSAMRKMYQEIVASTASVADVWVLYDSVSTRQLFEAALDAADVPADRVTWFPMDVESIWAIDFGPLPIVDPTTDTAAFADFRYYHGRPWDDAVPTRLAKELGATAYRMPLSFEGGNIQADGLGRCFTTQRGLQNSGVAQNSLENELLDYAGCSDVIVLKDVSDDATGHVDMFFKLVASNRSVLGKYAEGTDPENAQRMEDNAEILGALDPTMEILRLPMPGYGLTQGPLGGLAKSDVPYTYINATLINGINLWSVYDNPEWADSRAEAQSVWEDALPEYQHVAIGSDEVAASSGTIHCITRTIVDKALEKWVPDGSCVEGVCVPPDGFEDVVSTASCADDSTCFGPAWLCGCNDCTSECPAPQPVSDSCSGISFVGCCSQDVLVWCEEGQLLQQTCTAGSCGFSDTVGLYSCGQTGEASPDMGYPLACPDSAPCTAACSNRICGSDGCGGTCGECIEGEQCSDGICVERSPGTTDGATSDSGQLDAGDVQYTGVNSLATDDGCSVGGRSRSHTFWGLWLFCLFILFRESTTTNTA